MSFLLVFNTSVKLVFDTSNTVVVRAFRVTMASIHNDGNKISAARGSQGQNNIINRKPNPNFLLLLNTGFLST